MKYFTSIFILLGLLNPTNAYAKKNNYKIETRIKIALVDTGFNFGQKKYPSLNKYLCLSGHVDATGFGIEDVNGHGTVMAKLIADQINPKTTCILIVKAYHQHNYSNYTTAYELAIQRGVSYINNSAGGQGFGRIEKATIQVGLVKGIKFITAAGNDGQDLSEHCNYYPACYKFEKSPKNLYVIACLNESGDICSSSNRNGPVTNYIIGYGYGLSGTSVSTAIFTGQLAKKEHP